jgi:hypothetical protein
MAYLLQPGLDIVENPAVPPKCATDEVFVYPQPSNLNYCCRPNTVLYGTAPYMAGKGAPANLVMVADELRPQSTSKFNTTYVNTTKKNTFPWQDMKCSVPLRTISWEPQSTRAELQNSFFDQRYLIKK